MAKTYLDTVKYIVKAKIDVDGLIEKPDVVGAIFGQTEGLLGEELDLRELQKSGRIGRIEVDLETKNGKTHGTITVPSSLDKAETAIIAAALETVDRVGPCEAKIEVQTMEDTRAKKREYIIERAKELLRKLVSEKMPESKELADMVRAEVRQAELTEYGPEKIPAGPDVETSEEIIVVEGRADVLNLLKHGFKNVISLKGAKIPKTIIELAKKKTVTLFVDGDRGGDIIARQLAEATDVDFIARAPDGKEVEELTRKEIIKALRSKLPTHQYLNSRGIEHTDKPSYHHNNQRHDNRHDGHTRETNSQKQTSENDPNKEQLVKLFSNVRDKMKALFVDSSFKPVKETTVTEMIKEMNNAQGIKAVVFDGIVTQRLVDLASKKGIEYLVGLKAAKIKPSKVKVIVVQS